MEHKFKVGDIVIGNSMAEEHYHYTGAGSKCQVLRRINANNIEVRMIEPNHGLYAESPFWVMEDCFDLYHKDSGATPKEDDVLLLKIKTKYKQGT